MELSIVIPAYEEGDKVVRDIEAASRFMRHHGISGEILLVDDGSRDSTAQAARRAAETMNGAVRVIRNEVHRGKGHAVRCGITVSKGEYVLFADSGLCVPYEQALAGLELLRRQSCDLAHGSRKLPGSLIHRPQPRIRRIISRIMRQLFIHLLRIPADLTDTQCGFKLYRGLAARQLYSRAHLNGFLFDIEIILLARQLGYRIREFPIEWTADLDSRLTLFKGALSVMREFLFLLVHPIKRGM